MKTKDEKNEVKEQVRGDVRMLQEEIKKLKWQIGGHKSTNNLLRKELQKVKAHAKEADELNEQKGNRILELIAEQENISKELNETRESIKKSEQSFNAALELAKKELRDVEDERLTLETNIDWYNSLPWYRRIFKKI